MRILMTTSAADGVWGYTAELARELDRLGHQVVLASLGGTLSDAQRGEIGDLERVTLHESDYPLDADDDETLASAAEWLEALQRATRCDIVHCNDYGPLQREWSVPTLLVAHGCRYAKWRVAHPKDAGTQWQRYRERVAAALRNARHVVAPTNAVLRELEESYADAGLHARASVIYKGVDSVRWTVGQERERLFVLGVGPLADEGKNLQCLAAAAETLPCPVLIAAAGRPERGRAPRAILLKRLSRSRLAVYYRRARVLAHPARYEPFGLTVLEAALSGCALVLGDIATLRELWGPAAVFVEPTDREALHDAIVTLLRRPDELAEFGRRARRHALRYSARAMALSYVRRYESLLTPSSSAAAQ